MVLQQFLLVTKGKMTENSNQTETQNTSTAGFKASRMSASKFFKKALKKEELSKDETIRRLQDENRELRQELKDANTRIRELESAAVSNQPRESVMAPLRELTSVPSTIKTRISRNSLEHRDDDVGGEGIDDESDVFSVEVEAETMGAVIKHEIFDNEDEVHSISSSARTIPTGNDKISKFQRRQQEFRQKLRRSSSIRNRGDEAHLNYFSRRSPPLERITEINTRKNLLDDTSSGEDSVSTTSDLSMSISSSMLLDDEATDAMSLMSGRKVPLRTMKSLLRISSTDSDTFSYVQDDEQVLFGEI